MKTNRFIATLTAGAIALSTIGAAPARADKEFNTLLGALIVGAILLEANKSKDDTPQVTQKPKTHRYTHTHNGRTHSHAGELRSHHKHYNGHRYLDKHGRLIQDRKTTKATLPMPNSCKRRVNIRQKYRTAFSAKCLRKNGYHVSRQGTVSHRGWKGRTARPYLF